MLSPLGFIFPCHESYHTNISGSRVAYISHTLLKEKYEKEPRQFELNAEGIDKIRGIMPMLLVSFHTSRSWCKFNIVYSQFHSGHESAVANNASLHPQDIICIILIAFISHRER